VKPVPALGFSRDRRLTSASEFARVRTEGETARGLLLVLGLLRLDEASPFRAGFVTSKRVGGAVVRNRIRRRMREIVRRHQHEMHAGVWLVLIARPPSAQASYATLEDEYLRLAKRASILARS
jgi:ribonuclease P protein component